MVLRWNLHSLVSATVRKDFAVKSTSLSNVRRESTHVNLIKPQSVPSDYWKEVLWLALDLKATLRKNNNQSLDLLRNKHVTLLFQRPHGRLQLATSLGCSLLGARDTYYFEANFESQPNPADCGRVLTQITDMFVINGVMHDSLLKFSTHVTVPVYSALCNVYSLHKGLSDLMTLYERFQRLKGLKMAWIGPPMATLNTYLLLCPLFGMKIHYLCICMYGSGSMSPVKKSLEAASPESKRENMIEFKNVSDAVAGTNVIATEMHPNVPSQITLEVLEKADPNWVFLHSLPRSEAEVSDNVFNHPNNLAWETSKNFLYVAMAMMVKNLHDYRPTVEKPDF